MEVTQNEIISFEDNLLPNKWNKVRLKNLCVQKPIYGINIPNSKYADYGVRFLRTTDIDEDGNIDDNGIYISRSNVPSEYILKKGDLLFSRSGTIGRCYLHSEEIEYTYAGFLVKFQPLNFNVSKWLYYYSFSKHFKYQLFSEAIESTISNFNANKYATIRINFPKDENELKNILSFLDHKCEQINRFINNKIEFIRILKEQRQSVIDSYFNDESKFVKLKFLISKIGSGVTPRGGANIYKTSGIYFLRSQNIHNDGLRLDNVVYITREIHNSMLSSQVQKNDVLINITGASIGRSYIYNLEEEANINQHICILRPDKDLLVSEYLMYQLQSSRIQNLINMVEGASREGLTNHELKNYQISLVETKNQREIVKCIKEETKNIDELITKAEKEIILIKEFKESLISHAVTGQLRKINYKK